MAHPKFSEHIDILCFERRYLKQNSVVLPKTKNFAPTQFFGPSLIFGLATLLLHNRSLTCSCCKSTDLFLFDFGDVNWQQAEA